MAKKKRNQNKDAEWAEAKKLCRLSAEDVLKAKALGLGPKALMKNRPSPTERWKAPVNVWIRELYLKRFGTAHIEAKPASRISDLNPALIPRPAERAPGNQPVE
jgi:hypothetical protein